MATAAEILLGPAEDVLDLEPTRVGLQAENTRLRLTIAAAVLRLEEIHGEGQDVEALIAEVRDDLAAAVGERG